MRIIVGAREESFAYESVRLPIKHDGDVCSSCRLQVDCSAIELVGGEVKVILHVEGGSMSDGNFPQLLLKGLQLRMTFHTPQLLLKRVRKADVFNCALRVARALEGGS